MNYIANISLCGRKIRFFKHFTNVSCKCPKKTLTSFRGFWNWMKLQRQKMRQLSKENLELVHEFISMVLPLTIFVDFSHCLHHRHLFFFICRTAIIVAEWLWELKIKLHAELPAQSLAHSKCSINGRCYCWGTDSIKEKINILRVCGSWFNFLFMPQRGNVVFITT